MFSGLINSYRLLLQRLAGKYQPSYSFVVCSSSERQLFDTIIRKEIGDTSLLWIESVYRSNDVNLKELVEAVNEINQQCCRKLMKNCIESHFVTITFPGSGLN